MKKILLGSCILFFLMPLFAVKKTNPDKFRLINADKLYMSKFATEQILELNGNVHFFYGNTEFKSDKAMIFDTQKIARLFGSVKVTNDTLRLESDSLAYYRIPQVLNLGGQVKITQQTNTGNVRWFKGDYGIYDQARDTVTTWSNVSSYDQSEEAFAECGYAFWDRTAGYAYLIESPRVRFGTTDVLKIKADKMELFEKEKKLIATFNVEAQSNEYQASSDFLIYFAEEDKAVFIGEPHFNNRFADASAQEFHIWFEDRKISRAALVDSCKVIFSQDENGVKENWVHAQNINLSFLDDRITEFTADSEVTYYFVQPQEEKRDHFINSASGSYLEAKFGEDNKLKQMNMQGAIRGKYKFKNDS